MPMVQEILDGKGSAVHAVSDRTSVLEATRLMNQHKVGCLVVVGEAGDVTGIFTERDVLQCVVGEELDPSRTTVAQVMVREVICCRADDPIHNVQAVMRDQRVRHLPVVTDRGALVGLVSIGDLNAHEVRDGHATIHYLHDYIFGRV